MARILPLHTGRREIKLEVLAEGRELGLAFCVWRAISSALEIDGEFGFCAFAWLDWFGPIWSSFATTTSSTPMTLVAVDVANTSSGTS